MGDARRIKRVKSIKNAIIKLASLTPIQYKNADADADFQAGFIAQDLAKVFPEYVTKQGKDNGTDPLPPEDNNKPFLNKGWRVIGLDLLVPWIVAAIIELAEDLDQVKKRAIKQVKELTEKVTLLETRLASLEASVPANQQKIVLLEDRIAVLEKIHATLP